MNPLKDLIIVGGGTAGLISALYLKKYFPLSNIKLVKSSSEGIIGVGEGTTEQFYYFTKDLDIDTLDLINKTKATVKIGILFKDWNYLGDTYCHSILNQYKLDNDLGTLEVYNRFILNSKDPYILNSEFKEIYLQNKVPLTSNLKVSNQYHFDTFSLNSYLTDICVKRNITIEDHFIKDVKLDKQGNINSLLTSDNIIINGDFFIDCSGFKRVLSSKLDTKWQSYNSYLPTNRAITLSTNLNLDKGIEPYTKSTALSSGWAWKIPTQEKYGNGYVFDSNYIDTDNALNEFNKHLGTNVEKFAKDVKFEAGKLNKFWEKNCASIGLSGSFVEPLEAQSISFGITQIYLLINYLFSWRHNKEINTKYNKILDEVFENMVSYVQLHYITKRTDTPFWKDKPFSLTKYNKETLKRFSIGLKNPSDFNNPYLLFTHANFYQIYNGNKLLNIPKIKEIQKLNSPEYNQHWDQISMKHYYNEKALTNSISHIDYLKLVKENQSL